MNQNSTDQGSTHRLVRAPPAPGAVRSYDFIFLFWCFWSTRYQERSALVRGSLVPIVFLIRANFFHYILFQRLQWPNVTLTWTAMTWTSSVYRSMDNLSIMNDPLPASFFFMFLNDLDAILYCMKILCIKTSFWFTTRLILAMNIFHRPDSFWIY